jgi:hypothetical protein
MEKQRISFKMTRSENSYQQVNLESRKCSIPLFSSKSHSINSYEEKFGQYFETFALKVINFNLTHDITDKIFNLSKELMSNVNQVYYECASLNNGNQNSSDSNIFNSANDLILRQIEKWDTRYKRDKIIKAQSEYVEAKRIIIDNSNDPRSEESTNNSFYYVSILDTLKSLFSQEEFKEFYFQNNGENKPHKCAQGSYSDFCCGENFQKNTLFAKYPDSLQIQFFMDDFDPTAALKTKSGEHKICGVYFVIRNLPSKFLSKMRNMYLVALCKSSYIKGNFNLLLEPIVEDLKILESIGIDIGGGKYLRGTLINVAFDNLGGNIVFGMIQCFNANFYCRICISNKKECQSETNENPIKLRNRESYNESMNHIKINGNSNNKDNVNMHLGFKNYCILNELKYYHTAENRSQDFMHDLYEGCVPFLLKKVFSYFAENNIITIDNIKKLIRDFDYGFTERRKNGIPSVIKITKNSNKINQSASQARCLMIHTPFIFQQFYSIIENNPETKKVWECIETMLKIMQIVNSTSIEEEDLIDLENAITKHLKGVKSVFNVNLLPKHHFLCHYPNTIRAMGPLRHMWMIRGEAKHKEFTNAARNASNFRNICKTLADRHQGKISKEFSYTDDIQESGVNLKFIEAIEKDQYLKKFKHLFSEPFLRNDTVLKKMLQINNNYYREGIFILSLILKTVDVERDTKDVLLNYVKKLRNHDGQFSQISVTCKKFEVYCSVGPNYIVSVFGAELFSIC